ncbi:MAG: hypothetical protein HDS03_00790 [Bacteroides sp.]|nr:hypothetical protein [Bacteroides sp.]
MKSTIFNLIILDESGSMMKMIKQTIGGCNETLNTIRTAAEKHADSMRHLVSIYAFQSRGPVESRYLVKNANPQDVKDITINDYQPSGLTPLLDAVGSTLTELKMIASTHEDATGIVTIMTDGFENASRQYSWKQVAQLISQLREMGWTINLIGANIDVDKMASQLNINHMNAMSYTQSDAGTRAMWNRFDKAISTHIDEEAEVLKSIADPQERLKSRIKTACNFFKSDKEEEEYDPTNPFADNDSDSLPF